MHSRMTKHLVFSTCQIQHLSFLSPPFSLVLYTVPPTFYLPRPETQASFILFSLFPISFVNKEILLAALRVSQLFIINFRTDPQAATKDIAPAKSCLGFWAPCVSQPCDRGDGLALRCWAAVMTDENTAEMSQCLEPKENTSFLLGSRGTTVASNWSETS